MFNADGVVHLLDGIDAEPVEVELLHQPYGVIGELVIDRRIGGIEIGEIRVEPAVGSVPRGRLRRIPEVLVPAVVGAADVRDVEPRQLRLVRDRERRGLRGLAVGGGGVGEDVIDDEIREHANAGWWAAFTNAWRSAATPKWGSMGFVTPLPEKSGSFSSRTSTRSR